MTHGFTRITGLSLALCWSAPGPAWAGGYKRSSADTDVKSETNTGVSGGIGAGTQGSPAVGGALGTDTQSVDGRAEPNLNSAKAASQSRLGWRPSRAPATTLATPGGPAGAAVRGQPEPAPTCSPRARPRAHRTCSRRGWMATRTSPNSVPAHQAVVGSLDGIAATGGAARRLSVAAPSGCPHVRLTRPPPGVTCPDILDIGRQPRELPARDSAIRSN